MQRWRKTKRKMPGVIPRSQSIKPQKGDLGNSGATGEVCPQGTAISKKIKKRLDNPHRRVGIAHPTSVLLDSNEV